DRWRLRAQEEAEGDHGKPVGFEWQDLLVLAHPDALSTVLDPEDDGDGRPVDVGIHQPYSQTFRTQRERQVGRDGALPYPAFAGADRDDSRYAGQSPAAGPGIRDSRGTTLRG